LFLIAIGSFFCCLFTVVPVLGLWFTYWISTESLILAQDERWRRA
jgi:hypothetical protein